MKQQPSGIWKSDFQINKKRYQPTWNVATKKEALALEAEAKARIKASNTLQSVKAPLTKTNHQELSYLMGYASPSEEKEKKGKSLTDARDFMIERKWKMLKDSKNPESRFNRIIMHFGNIDITEFNTKKVAEWREHMLIVEQKADKTVNHYLGLLKTTIELLVVSGEVDMGIPAFGTLRMPKGAERLVNFTRLEESQMFNTLKARYEETRQGADWEMLHYFIIQASLGLRPSELFYLPFSKVDLVKEKVTIKYAQNGTTKNNVTRTLPIGGAVLRSFKLLLRRKLELLFSGQYVEELSTYMKVGTLTLTEEGQKVTISHYLSDPRVARSTVTRLTQKMVADRWNRMRKTLGWVDSDSYAEYVPYGLRHTVASRLVGEMQFNAHQIMSFMGHKDIATSMKYVHLNVSHLEEAIKIGNTTLEV